MKKLNYLFAMLAVAVAFGFGTTALLTEYSVDTEKSEVKWVGRKVTGEHFGKVTLKNGQLNIENGKLTGGSFAVDMTSIVSEDLSGDSKGKLEGHLKSDDFFGVEKYPDAKFVITNAEKKSGNQYQVTGDLTVKGKTNPVTFPAEVVVTDNNVFATATITVDRSKYDVRFGSGSFFDNLGDKTIYDNFELQVKLVANK